MKEILRDVCLVWGEGARSVCVLFMPLIALKCLNCVIIYSLIQIWN